MHILKDRALSARHSPRILRPHRDWLVLDFVFAAIGIAFLVLGLTGLVRVVEGAAELAALTADCGDGVCQHAGILTAKERTHFPSGGYAGLYDVGPSPDYCVLAMSLDTGKQVVAVAGPICDELFIPSPIKVELWHGRVVEVEIKARTITTYFHPSFAIFSGLIRAIAFVPFGLFVALIKVDVAHHRPVWKIRHRLPLWPIGGSRD